MSKEKSIWVAVNKDDFHQPFMSSDTFEGLHKAINEYYAVDKGAAKCSEFEPCEWTRPDMYALKGRFEYIYRDTDNSVVVDKIIIYCDPFIPETKKD